ncbi:MAG: N-acetyl-gamma-glutamyl-phosphate reductase, partial [Acutalibacteraceae bacterium]|nr:N-acetyl-gamma-glutamyl-phosphate reductase [Acutalibacteraceae bacterium]
LKEGVTKEQIRTAYETKYANEQFVRVLPDGATANLRNVKFTNICDISLHIDSRTGTLIVVSTIDNMVKGAAGQAIQNMNLIMGLEENAGLNLVPPAF